MSDGVYVNFMVQDLPDSFSSFIRFFKSFVHRIYIVLELVYFNIWKNEKIK